MSRVQIAGAVLAAGLAGGAIAEDPAPQGSLRRGPTAPPRSSAWLSRLPDGEAKRKFILDCTGCHQFDEKIARRQGTPRTEAQWAEAVTRMLGYAGATTSFPVIAADRDAKATAAWLAKSLAPGDVADIAVTASRKADIREYLMPVAQDLPHDLVVEPNGDVLITGMFTHRLYRLKPDVLFRYDPVSSRFDTIPLPSTGALVRHLAIDARNGAVWLAYGASPGIPARVARVVVR